MHFEVQTGRQRCCFVVPFLFWKAILTVPLRVGVRSQSEHLVAGVASDNTAKTRERYWCPL